MQVSLLQLWNDAGGFARGIIILLAIMSIVSLGTAAAKWWRFRKSRSATRRFAPEFGRFLQEEELDGAIELAEAEKTSHVARVLGEALSEIKPLLHDREAITSGDINSAERAVERQSLILLSELKAGMAILATVGATAPFVGLLGTTMGVVNAFTGMALTGSGGLAAISAGIAEALITTAFGLGVAIPAVWLYNYFQTKIENITVEMTYTSKELIDFLIKSVGSEFGRSIFTKEFKAQQAATEGP
ncbi:MAG: MotA/TolQ/ExbB proton channel family protein [Gemmatimonadales bacterium]